MPYKFSRCCPSKYANHINSLIETDWKKWYEFSLSTLRLRDKPFSCVISNKAWNVTCIQHTDDSLPLNFRIKALIASYTWRGTLLLSSGIVLHAVPMTMCMNRKTRKQEKQKKAGLEDNNTRISLTDKNMMAEHRKVSLEHVDKTGRLYQLCKNKIYLGVLLTMFLSNFAISASGVFLPHFIRTNYPTSYSSQIVSSISILGAGDLCGRLMAGVLGNYLSISKLLMLSIDMLFIGIGNLVTSFCISYRHVMACTFIVGFGAGKYISPCISYIITPAKSYKFIMWPRT